jgi:phosphoenolpyruvate carboxykinase (GTP)
VPAADALDVAGLDLTARDLEIALDVDVDEWKAEIPLIEEWFAKLGDTVPTELKVELDNLKARLG